MAAETRILKVHATTAIKGAIDRLTPPFEQATSVKLDCSYGPSGRMQKKIAEGAVADVAIVSGSGIDALIAAGRLIAGTRADIAGSRIGLAVSKEAARPDISSAARFKETMLAARRIAMSNPTGGGQSGAHLAKVFDRLGITDAMRDKLIYGPGGPAGLVGNYILRGEADIGLQQMPELLAVPGIDIVGPLSDDVQFVTMFSAGITAGASNRPDCDAFIAHLRTQVAADVLASVGLEPAKP